MAATSQSGQSRRGSSRGRTQAKRTGSSTSRSTSSNGTSGSGSNSKTGTTKSAASRSRSNGSSAAKRASSATKSATSKASSTASSSNGDGNQKSSNGTGSRDALTQIGVSVFSAAVGAVGGALLSRKAKPQRKVLGIPMPEKVDLSGVADQIGAAGKQFGELAGEVRAVRQKAEQLGKLLS